MIESELTAENTDHSHWTYRLHKEDERLTQDRQVIETIDGNLAKTLLINGQPLTQDQRSKDEERMKSLVDSPEERAKRKHRESQDEEKARQLLKAIPDAFLFEYDGTEDGLVRLTFKPNPHYSPASRELMVYHAMTGRLWIDPVARRLGKIEGQLMEDVKFGFGLLGHLDKGGTIKVVQKNVGGNHWEAVMLDLNIQGRAVIFKSINVKEKQILTDFRRVADNLTMNEAFTILQKASDPVAENQSPR